MNISRNLLYLSSLNLLFFSCGPQKNVAKVQPKTVVKNTTSPTTAKNNTISTQKPKVSHEGKNEFYKVNIADQSKNDNTISYGSIVSANPTGYRVSKDYFPSIGQNFRQRFLILHYTVSDLDQSISKLTQQSVSAHYLVNDLNDREIYQLVDENKRAYHAGISYWRGFEQLNDNSIGIEIVNKGYITSEEGQKIFFDYPEWQFRKVAALVKDIVTRYHIPPTNVLAHSDIAPTRKQDPGPKFPWKRLYDEYQVGMWYDEKTKQYYMSQIDGEYYYTMLETPEFIYEYQNKLKKLGYQIATSGTNDDTNKKIIEAFQYHFRPGNCNGVMDMETYAVLQALLFKYPRK